VSEACGIVLIGAALAIVNLRRAPKPQTV
jgi:hypothetical protein